MPEPAQGELRHTEDGLAARITIKGRQRKTFALPTCHTDDEGLARMIGRVNVAQSLRISRRRYQNENTTTQKIGLILNGGRSEWIMSSLMGLSRACWLVVPSSLIWLLDI